MGLRYIGKRALLVVQGLLRGLKDIRALPPRPGIWGLYGAIWGCGGEH